MSPTPVAKLSALPDVGAVRVVVDGEPVALVRDENGDLHAIGDTCTHAEVSLAEGEVDDCSIECWLHGSRFDLRTGQPTALPAIRPVPVYRVSVDGDDVLVDVTRTVNAPVNAPVNALVNAPVNAEVNAGEPSGAVKES